MNTHCSFREAIAIKKSSNGTITWNPIGQWNQGRGIYGGLIFATAIQVIKEFSRFPVRRLSVDLCAPVLSEETTITIRELRRGTNTQYVQLEFTQQNKVVIGASAVCGGSRNTDLDCHQNIRSLSPPEDEAIPFHPSMPSFSRFFEYWPQFGIPFSNTTELSTGGWIRCRGSTLLDQAILSALIDAWWPALYVAIETPRPVGTVSCSIDFTHPSLPMEHRAPLWIENKCTEVRDGYSVEENHLWSAQGTLLGRCNQLIALIR
jgi:hypothetical protein